MRRLVGLLIGVLSLAIVLIAVTWAGDELTSPGPLHPSHASIESLQGGDGCAACHGDRQRGLAAACETCHEEIAVQRELGSGLHGVIANSHDIDVLACGACHIEHTGAHVPLIGPHAFRMAGVADLESFDHSAVTGGYGLNGEHETLACERCHEHAAADALDDGEFRFLGLEQRCASCHEDPHAGGFGADCASCHGQGPAAFELVAEFDHTRWYPLTGEHARVACKLCHDDATLRGADIAMARALPPDGSTGVAEPHPPRACAQCHADPHAVTSVAAALVENGAADRLGVPRFDGAKSTDDGCATCHTTAGFDAAVFGAADHARLGFELLGEHASVTCTACHGSHGGVSLEPRPSRWTTAPDAVGTSTGAPSASSCAACHADPHGDSFLHEVATRLAIAIGDTCVQCHAADDSSFRTPQAEFERALHAATGFALTAPHDTPACEACHPGQLTSTAPFAQRYAPTRTPDACSACHPDPHGGQFDSAGPRACTDCHAHDHFVPTAFDHAAHARTTFALDGAHAAVACSACHPLAELDPLAAPMRKFAGTPTECAACHDDPHRGEFDVAGRPSTVDGRGGCARCHTAAESFADVRWRADEHARWTDFALHGAHVDAACVKCHGHPFESAPRDCAACHDDVHAGQFARPRPGSETGFTDCARCHFESRTFTDLHFDHDRDSRFALDETHAALRCDACHKPVTDAAGERTVVRYRPLGTRCIDCHANGTDRGRDR